MARMLDMMRESVVPATLMRSAAHGALSLPAAEMLEILVFLSTNAMFGEQARLTLASWDEASACAVLADRSAPIAVLDYFSAPHNVRGTLLPALLENPAVADSKIVLLAEGLGRQGVRLMLETSRVRQSGTFLAALKRNPRLSTEDHAAIDAAIAEQAEPHGPTQYELDHAEEIAAEAHKRFELVRGDADEKDELADLLPLIEEAPVESAATRSAMVAAHAAQVSAKKSEERERVSTLQKIARLSVGERVQLAMKGNKDERFILVRDGSKVVCLAVLESPKVSESEVEMFAGMKNVQEAVLRGIATKRKFLKNYSVIRALTNNPRVPLDLSLPMLSHLLAGDLKNLSMNKNVSDTLKKLALKMYKEKASSRKS